ncbi:hypothetical protein SB6416_01518 [Klebsiella pasteurii]|nr:hypothetical protein SB6416_01518 [Klebsiella pasteurii]
MFTRIKSSLEEEFKDLKKCRQFTVIRLKKAQQDRQHISNTSITKRCFNSLSSNLALSQFDFQKKII